MIGKCLGNRYEILDQLGGGGMSLVYKAKDKFLNRLVTIKVLRSIYTSDNEFARRFKREARAVASLSHPNIVNIHDIGQEDAMHYLVIEYIDGENLKEFIRKNKEITFQETLNIISQICEALQHAHDNNIVHRDVKPQNILIANDGRVKLTDFGIAVETTETITNNDMVMGSVHYISPEQAQGKKATSRSDIYSLGVILYEMLTGRLPFTGDNPVAVALKHVQEEPERPSRINPAISEELERVVMKALEKDPQKRYPTARQFSEDLNKAISDIDYSANKKPDDFSTKILPTIKVNKNKEVENTKDSEKTKKSNSKNKLFKILGIVFLIMLSIVGGIALALFKYLDVRDVEVPNVVGMPVYDAKTILKEKGLGSIIIEVHDDAEKGMVIKQNPGRGMMIKEGRDVELTVSLGSKLLTLPDVREYLLSNARISLHNAGFKYTVEEIYDEKPAGVVLDQNPPAGKYTADTVVKLTVSKGAKPVIHEMPNLIGLTLEKAREKLIRMNLLIDEPPATKSSTKFLQGMIMEQYPAHGEEINEGSAVSVVVSEGPGPPIHSAQVEILLEDDIPNPKVRITVDDIRGEHDTYVAVHLPGEIVIRTVEYYSPAIIRVYINDVLKQEKHL